MWHIHHRLEDYNIDKFYCGLHVSRAPGINETQSIQSLHRFVWQGTHL